MTHLIAPSILTVDFANLQKEIMMLNSSVADWIHLDIMDGVYVPNISFGFPILESVKKIAKKPLDVHLMIANSEPYLKRFKDAGADILTVHYEACTHLHRTVNEIRMLGMKAGVALNPHTPVILLKNILPYIDMVLIMTVNPGYGGQSFIDESWNKISELRQLIDESKHDVLIQVDGGVDLRNARLLVNAGVNVLVVGNTVFSSANPAETILRLKKLKD
ncbi:MAG TPA: ribulose-phosphate 3-epimerase [Bacteroidales bacterium]|nr:ribulose-phosphate 3-epimerase [Bacteroidales bacterium]HOU95747.1 ribulose-phosphate 3-epimerase [Bacteroidales bacterium]HQG36731.1 ribulose-phosphate 3-epimerase [Bacteroidales bacterium]HQG52865.1 ribulose-phosphate 3-epimerase [Bacteroidales bacterium]HQJ20184.1 ribulose-phosphate 3-epimerase [Bacteroidales bacterium]